MRKTEKALSMLLIASIALTPMTSFAMLAEPPVTAVSPDAAAQDGELTDADRKIVPPDQMVQKPLTEKDKEAVAFALEKYKELFGKSIDESLYIKEVYFTSADTQYPLPYYYRHTVSVSFIPKDYVKQGVYIAYYEDNKEIMSISSMDINYEAKINYTKEQAQKIAEDFMKDNDLADISSYKVQVNSYVEPYMQNYPVADFFYIKQVNGLAFDADSVSVSVDLNTGKVISFYKNSPKGIEFPDAKPALTEAEALAIVRENAKVTLRYMTDMKNQKVAIPVYTIDTSAASDVDAKTKEPVNYTGDMKIETFTPDKARTDQIINDAEPKAKVSVTRQQAIDLAKATIKEFFGKDLTPNKSEDYFDPENVFVTFTDSESKIEYSVGIELKTGKITYIGAYPVYEEPTAQEISETSYLPGPVPPPDFTPIAYETAYYKALEYAAQLYPEYLTKVDLSQVRYIFPKEQEPYVSPEYGFTFSRIENGITYPENSVNVMVSAKDASLMSLSAYWEDNKLFVDPAGIITKEKALDVFFSDKQMNLKYMLDYTVNKEEDGPAVKLIYTLAPKDNRFMSWDIDALTGKFIIYPVMPID